MKDLIGTGNAVVLGLGRQQRPAASIDTIVAREASQTMMVATSEERKGRHLRGARTSISHIIACMIGDVKSTHEADLQVSELERESAGKKSMKTI